METTCLSYFKIACLSMNVKLRSVIGMTKSMLAEINHFFIATSSPFKIDITPGFTCTVALKVYVGIITAECIRFISVSDDRRCEVVKFKSIYCYVIGLVSLGLAHQLVRLTQP